MPDIEFGGGGGGKKLFKNKGFVIAAVAVGVIGLIVMLKKSSASPSEEVTSGEANYPSAYNNVDTVAQMQNMQGIVMGAMDARFNEFAMDYQADISQVKTDIGEQTKAANDALKKEIKKETAKKEAIHATVQTDFFGEKWKANYVYKTLLSNGAEKATVKRASNGSYYVEAKFKDSAKADAAAQNAIKQTKDTDKRIGFKNYSKTVVK